MKINVKRLILKKCADNRLLKKTLTQYKIHKFSKHLLAKDVVLKCEKGEISKQEAVDKAAARWRRIVKRDNKTIESILKNAPDCRGLSSEQQKVMRTDMLFCRFAYGFIPHEYICFHLMDKTADMRKQYVSESDHMRYIYTMNDPVDIMIFNDKMKTYEKFGVYYHREVISIESPEDYIRFEKFVKTHPVFVKKQVYESCGNSIERIDINSCGKTLDELFADFLSQEKVILEELVRQGETTAIFNPSSVNTIRCITFNTKDGIKAPYCFMKIGRAGSFVDNGGAGGILVGIDEITGITNTAGVDELRNVYDIHPDSGVQFSGHQLPEWDKMLAICKEMAEKIPSVPFIGWDLAYTDKNEWVVIEGNGMSQFIGPQTIWQRGIKSEVQKLMQEL